MTVDIGLFDRAGARLGWLNDATGIQVIWRYNQRGHLTLTVPGDHIRAAQLVSPGARICFSYLPAASATPLYLSGRVTTVQAQGPVRGSTLVITVTADWPDTVLAWPVPANTLSNQNVEYYRATGPAETVIKNLITANAVTRLGLPWTVTASSGRGNTVTVAARYTPIPEVLESLADPGIGLSMIRYPGDTTTTVDVYEPVDRTVRVMSEDSGAITQWAMTMNGPTVTRVVVGMDGEGTARIMASRVDAATEAVYEKIETFVDARDVATVGEGEERGDAAIVEGAPTVSISATLSETPFWRVGTTLNLGDIVTVEPLPGLVSVERVTEIDLSYTSDNGLVVTPKLGDPSGSDPSRLLADKMARIAKAVRQLRAR